jgi:hypothetical protein
MDDEEFPEAGEPDRAPPDSAFLLQPSRRTEQLEQVVPDQLRTEREGPSKDVAQVTSLGSRLTCEHPSVRRGCDGRERVSAGLKNPPCREQRRIVRRD